MIPTNRDVGLTDIDARSASDEEPTTNGSESLKLFDCLQQMVSFDPAWRFNRALRIVSNPRKKLGEFDDEWTSKAVEYLRRFRALSGEGVIKPEKYQILYREFPDIVVADRIHRDAEMRPLKLEIESRILADALDTQIAESVNLKPAHVTAYHELYFYVRNRSKSGQFIQLVTCKKNDPKVSDLERELRKTVLTVGPDFVEQIVHYATESGRSDHDSVESIKTRFARWRTDLSTVLRNRNRPSAG